MSDYQVSELRAADIGLVLRDATDKVGEGRWTKLNNVRASQETLLATRPGRARLLTLDGPVHTLKRLTDDVLLVGGGTRLYANGTAYSNGPVFSGSPLTIIPFEPERGSELWAYIADQNSMWKAHADGTISNWGIAPPLGQLSASIFGTGGLNSTVSGAVGYDWRSTYYNSRTGAESNPTSIMTNKVSAAPSTGANVAVTASGDDQVDVIRLYRRGGTIPSQWRLSATGPNATGFIRDETSDEDLATASPINIDNDVPFTTVASDGSSVSSQPLPYIAGPFLGKYIMAVGDPFRPGYLYWTNAGNPDGASSANNVQVTSANEPLIGIAIHNGQPVVMTRDNFYAINFGQQGVTFSGRKTSVGRGLAAPYAFAVGPELYFLSQDGIYATDGESPAEHISEDIRPIFRGVIVGDFNPVNYDQQDSLRLYYVGQDLHFLYKDTALVTQHLVWNSQYGRWRTSSSAEHVVSVVYGDENQNEVKIFYGSTVGGVYQEGGLTDDGVAIHVTARTGSIDQGVSGVFKEWGNILVDADTNSGNMVITPRTEADQTVLPSITVNGAGRVKYARSLEDVFSHSISFDFQWDGAAFLYLFSLLGRPDQKAIRHWEFPPTSHGLTGWQFLRDGYITVRSSDAITLSVEVDGVSHGGVFRTASNTAGEKRKLYFDIPPTKGKLFRYIVNSPGDFRLYGEDCELRMKVWNTSSGYQLVSPFRAAPAVAT